MTDVEMQKLNLTELKERLESGMSQLTIYEQKSLVESCGVLWAASNALDILLSEEGSSVTFCSDNPDFNHLPNCKIYCSGFWTNFKKEEFVGDSLYECLYQALTTYQESKQNSQGSHAAEKK